ncbi:hypothetical protein C8J56DRAFT_1029771 [Mycena floridula]|nr:hypothetical protein C8J56DRAFT_1029771 [Mycena floridula]
MLGELCVVMLLAGVGRCTFQHRRDSVTPLVGLVGGGKKKERVPRSVTTDYPQNAETTASSQNSLVNVSSVQAVFLQDRDSEVHNVDPTPLSPSPTTIRQQQIGAQSQNITARIRELEGWVPRLQDAEAEIQRLRAEIQWLQDQEQSDWALGLTNSPPPSYRDPSMAGST